MVDYVPIKVKIGLRPNGHADYPDWAQLPMIDNEREMRDHTHDSWVYDKVSGHTDDDLDSPKGQQWGMLLATPEFAAEALTIFPTLVTRMTESEAESFWENRAHAHLPDDHRDVDALTGIQAELVLIRNLLVAAPTDSQLLAREQTVMADALKALDPSDRTAGVTKNSTRRWADVKTKFRINIV